MVCHGSRNLNSLKWHYCVANVYTHIYAGTLSSGPTLLMVIAHLATIYALVLVEYCQKM